jgi:hypothetical protein
VPPPVAAPNKFTIPDDPKPVAAPVSGEVGPSANQNTGDQPTPAKPDGDKPETLTPEQEAKRKQSRFDRKIDKAYRRAAEAQARADLLEKELAKVRPAATADTEAPTLEKHNYDPEAYAAAKAKY